MILVLLLVLKLCLAQTDCSNTTCPTNSTLQCIDGFRIANRPIAGDCCLAPTCVPITANEGKCHSVGCITYLNTTSCPSGLKNFFKLTADGCCRNPACVPMGYNELRCKDIQCPDSPSAICQDGSNVYYEDREDGCCSEQAVCKVNSNSTSNAYALRVPLLILLF